MSGEETELRMRALKEFPVAKNGKLDPIQAKMMKVLDDGQPHWREELYSCLYDDLGNLANNVNYHICMIRKHLATEGQFAVVTHKIAMGSVKYQKVPLSMTMPPSPA